MGLRLEPVGPLPASTYWRRRAVIVAALVVLLLVLLKACSGGGDDKAQQITPPVVTTTAPATSLSPTPTPTPTGAPDCTAANGLRITVTADSRSYPLGTTARFTMTISNAGTASCTIGLGQGNLEFRVASGNDRIWSSDDCSPGGPISPAVLDPGQEQAASSSWSLTRSAPGCKGGQGALKTGTYVMAARVGTTNSEKFTFSVTAKAG